MRVTMPLALSLATLLVGLIPAHAAEPLSVKVEPQVIKIGLFFNGADLQVNADTPAGCDVAMVVTGKSTNLKLSKKGKKAGVLWMNVGSVSYDKVPSLYVVHSSRPLKELASTAELERLGLGYGGLARKITGSHKAGPLATFAELVKLKEHDGLFAMDEHNVKVRKGKNGRSRATASIRLPAKALPGGYSVRVMCFREHRLAHIGEGHFKLRYGSSVSFISDLAYKHGLLYGILASVIAILAGLFTGLVFGRKGGGAH